MKNRIATLLICAVVVLALSVAAIAAETPVYNSESDLTIQYKYGSTALENTRFELYFIAERESANDYTLAQDFAAFSGDFDPDRADTWPDGAAALAQYAVKNNVEPVKSGKTDSRGSISFASLKAGLYLVRGERCVVGGKAYICTDFVIALPEQKADGSFNCDVSSYPKAEQEGVTPTPPPTPPGDLPQTGQIWWPVPILLCTGLLCLVIGTVRRRENGK